MQTPFSKFPRAFVVRGLIPFVCIAAVLASQRSLFAQERLTVDNCMISLIDEALVPAREAGVLTEIFVREGQFVERGHLLAQIDDAQPQVLRRLAEREMRGAQKQAESDVNVRYALAAFKVAELEWRKALEANAKVNNVHPEIEVKKLELTKDRSALQIEQAELEQAVAAMTAEARGVEVEGAELAIAQRRTLSPIEGVVVQRLRKAGEWVAPGQPIVHIARIGRLKVEGFVEARHYEPRELEGQPITIHVRLTDRRTHPLKGRIEFVSPVVDASGEFRIVAEFDNPRDGQHYIVRPGLSASIVFDDVPSPAARN